MSPAASPGPALLKPVIAIIVLFVVLMLVLSYWGEYRSTGDAQGQGETTGTVDATGTAGAEAGDEPTQSGEGESGDSSVPDTTESLGTVVVLIDGLNFRTGPSREADLIQGLDRGTQLTHLGTEDGWYKVRTNDGTEGYVSASPQYTQLQQ